ncbi:hypothetical protein B0H17DRAFT_643816 [Mycena rosella]|uniref:Uncharacterized protein n=1 Tax=Mycena rosella TaxID=1033263 RepID=A0AAD7FVF6_MYCRO|nr:hypothetical protein B0H17DRAFT_1106007 [Mycena rosella]KAJ7689186.1 hypothetical protein B0H17DRAFT_643816 [Mycena rosella]
MPRKKTATDGPRFTATSTLKCPKCLRDIPVGTGGQANLNSNHIDPIWILSVLKPSFR